MTENVTVFGDIADKFDALVAYDEKGLDNWVEEGGYSLGRMVAASTLNAFMTFAKGFVDTGRIGNGILIEEASKVLEKTQYVPSISSVGRGRSSDAVQNYCVSCRPENLCTNCPDQRTAPCGSTLVHYC